jgi:hypothetical protein
MKNIVMKCGHTANAVKLVKGEEVPCCVICDCIEPCEKSTNLDNREARCTYCGHKVKSDINLPFFEYRPNDKYDKYYDGCFGWD